MLSISLKLTNSLLRKIKSLNEGTLIINDLDELSLKLRISWTVRKTCSVEKKFRKEGLKIKIGLYPNLSIKEARKKGKIIKDINSEWKKMRSV